MDKLLNHLHFLRGTVWKLTYLGKQPLKIPIGGSKYSTQSAVVVGLDLQLHLDFAPLNARKLLYQLPTQIRLID